MADTLIGAYAIRSRQTDKSRVLEARRVRCRVIPDYFPAPWPVFFISRVTERQNGTAMSLTLRPDKENVMKNCHRVASKELARDASRLEHEVFRLSLTNPPEQDTEHWKTMLTMAADTWEMAAASTSNPAQADYCDMRHGYCRSPSTQKFLALRFMRESRKK